MESSRRWFLCEAGRNGCICAHPVNHFRGRGFVISAPILALVARLAAAVIAALSFLVITPGLAVYIGLKSPTNVARRRFVCGPLSEFACGAERIKGPLGTVEARI